MSMKKLSAQELLKIDTLLSILEMHRGHADAIGRIKLAELMQLSDKPLKELIHDAVVCVHSPIIGDTNGYYLAETAEEYMGHLAVLKSRKMATQERYHAMLAMFRKHAEEKT